jgi:hypothetical protein
MSSTKSFSSNLSASSKIKLTKLSGFMKFFYTKQSVIFPGVPIIIYADSISFLSAKVPPINFMIEISRNLATLLKISNV